MNLTFTGTVDVHAIIDDMFQNVSSVDGIGSDGDSSYDVTDYTVTVNGDEFVVEVTVERTDGKFASKDDIGEAIIDQVDEVSVDADMVDLAVSTEPVKRTRKVVTS